MNLDLDSNNVDFLLAYFSNVKLVHHKSIVIEHFLHTKPMNWSHIFLTRNTLKLKYGNLGFQNFSGGETPGHPPSGEAPSNAAGEGSV